jgi:hypothetical protein
LTVEGQNANPLSINIGTTPAAPSLSTLSPTSATVGSTVMPFVINGSNLTGGVVGISPATGLTLSAVTVTATRITGQLVIAPNAPTGACAVSVLTGGGLSNSLTFTVNPPPIPSIGTVLPWSINSGQTTAISIEGSNLSGVTGIQFTPPDGLTVSNVVATGTTVTASIAVAANAAYGTRQFVVVSPAGNSNPFVITILTQDPTFVISNLVVGPGTNTPYLTLPVSVTFQDPSGAVSSGQQVTMDLNIGSGEIVISAFLTPAGLTPGQTTGTIGFTLNMTGYTWNTGKTIPITVDLQAPAGRLSNTLVGGFVTQ